MTHEEKLHIDLLWYQAMEDCVKEDSIRYAFAALVQEMEREVCAKVCETYEVASIKNDAHNIAKIFNHCAAAIRTRSNP